MVQEKKFICWYAGKVANEHMGEGNKQNLATKMRTMTATTNSLSIHTNPPHHLDFYVNEQPSTLPFGGQLG